MTNTRKKDECQKASFFFSFFQISDKLFSLRVPFTEPWSSARCLNPHLNCNLSSWVGVWKCILRVSVFMLILARTPFLPNMACTKPWCPFFHYVLFALFLACERCLGVIERLLIFSTALLHRGTAVLLMISEKSCFPLEFQKEP